MGRFLVIIGGLISCTLLDFIVRPALFRMFGKKPAERHAARSAGVNRAFEELAKEYDRIDESNLAS